jgi:hypothetical protein
MGHLVNIPRVKMRIDVKFIFKSLTFLTIKFKGDPESKPEVNETVLKECFAPQMLSLRRRNYPHSQF